MHDTVFVRNLGVRWTRGEDQTLHRLRRVAIQHEELAEAGARGAEQVQPVLLRTRECLLMAKDDTSLVILELDQGDETAPLQFVFAAGRAKALRVGIKTWSLV